jgi:hypothetical protein
LMTRCSDYRGDREAVCMFLICSFGVFSP